MAKFTRLVNGVLRSFDEANGTSIYDESLLVVASGAVVGQVNGPITTGAPVTLPLGKTYTAYELEVYLNGQRLEDSIDYAFNSSTTVVFTFDIIVGDLIRFRIDRPA
jgi:hypothetical protein